ncbi:hypothetical protein ACFU6R_08970 [Streptomyces sp. NPDC057499]|uniref:COG1470 family protein n=1 Tax=Streptomyces sp. NPDC057499 TaxID=3346150 RepID=UPI00368599EF
MSLTASLDEASVTAAPGEETALPLRILNSGSTVEEYRFEVLGACAAWSTVEPATLSLYPGDTQTVSLRLRPPRDSTVPAGETAFGIRVVPTSEQGDAVVPEGKVTVLPFVETTAELVPRSSHGAWSGRHQLAVDNRGNAPLTVRLGSRPGTERARVSFAADSLRIEPGRAEFGKVRIRPVKRVWRGIPLTHSFQLLATPEVGEGAPVAPVVVDGTYQQEPILPRWLPRALILAAVLLIALVGLWYALLRPAVKSAAREAITPDAVRSAAAADKSKAPEKGGTAGASGGGDSSGANGGSPKPSPSPSSGDSSDPGVTTPTSAQVQVKDSVGGGSNTSTALQVPSGHTFQLTDIVVQNPQGDGGTLEVSSGRGAPLFRLALENFRDSDYHFVTPIMVPAGGKVTLTVDCRKVGKPVNAPTPSRCAESMFLGGTMKTNATD